MKNVSFITVLLLLLAACSKEEGLPMPEPISEGHYIEIVSKINLSENGRYLGGVCVGGGNIVVDWGDGTRELLRTEFDVHDFDHTYESAGPYKIKIQTDELKRLYIGNAIGVLPKDVRIGACPQLVELEFSLQPETESFLISDCPNLSQLSVHLCDKMVSVDFSDCVGLNKLTCSGKLLADIDLSHNTELTEVSFSNGNYTHLDLSNNLKIVSLECSNNRLTTLDVSKQSELRTLYCGNNLLTKLNLEKNTKLTNLECSGNGALTELELSPCESLSWLGCRGNKMETLDINRNTHLTTLYCGGNLFKQLDLSRNTKLRSIECADCRLAELDLSNQPDIRIIDCHNNQLEREALETLFEVLPVVNGTATTRKEAMQSYVLSIIGNPGYEKYSVESYNKFLEKGWHLVDGIKF